MDYNGMNNYRNQMQESLIDAIKILYDGAITNEKIPKTLECIVSDDSKREQGIYKVKYMHNEFEVSCPLSEIYNRGDAVIVLVPDGDFSKTKIITGSADASGKSSSTDVEANPAAPATQELNKVRIGDIVYDIPEGGGTENAVKDVVVNGISVVTNQIARLSAVSQQELINALSTKVNVTDFETLENEVDNLSDMVDEKASQQDLDDLSSVVDEKADASDVEAELAEKVDLSTYNTDMSLKADKTALDLKQDQLEFNTLEAATEVLTRLKADNKVYNLGGGTTVEANPSEAATDDLETIKIGDTVYDIPSGGSSTNYGKFTYDLLLENNPLPPYQNASNGVNRTYTLSKSIDDYDAVYVISCTDYGSEQTLAGCTDRLILKNNYYDSSHVLSGSYTDGRLMYVTFADDTTVSTAAWGNAGYCPVLYKVYGVKFENKLINRSDIYSEEERMIGRWTDGKPLYQKTVVWDNPTLGRVDNLPHGINNVDHIHISWWKAGIITGIDNTDSNYWADVWVCSDTGIHYRLGPSWGEAIKPLIVTFQYTKTTDTPDSGVIPEDPMIISDPMIYSEEEQVVGSWTDGKPLYQKTVTISSVSYDSSWHEVNHNISNIDAIGSVEGVVTDNGAAYYPANSYRPAYTMGVVIGADKTKIQYMNNWLNTASNLIVTLRYTKTTDSVLSGPKKGKIVQRSDIYSEEERLVGRWTDGKPLYQKTWNGLGLTIPQTYWQQTSISMSDMDYWQVISNKNDGTNYDNQYSMLYRKINNLLQVFCPYEILLDSLTIQYTKTTDLPFSKQLIEDPQFVMMSDIYSEDEQVVGRWTDGKPLYQKTWNDLSYTVANTNWINFITVPNGIDLIEAKFYGKFANDLYEIVCEEVHIDSATGTLEAWFRLNGTRTVETITLQYTKTTDAPGTGPTKGNLIYLPALYSEEEREVGVWTDGKPVYQKTVNVGSITAGGDKRVSASLSIDKIIDISGNAHSSNYNQWVKINFPHQNIAAYIVTAVYIESSQEINIHTGTDFTLDKCYITLQYTKTTDQPGSGTWTPEGQLAHHYSTSEKIVGTWIDGSTVYERTWDLGNITIPNNNWTNTSISSSGINRIIKADGLNNDGNYKSVETNIYSTQYVQLLSMRSNGSDDIRYLTLQYTKSS